MKHCDRGRGIFVDLASDVIIGPMGAMPYLLTPLDEVCSCICAWVCLILLYAYIIVVSFEKWWYFTERCLSVVVFVDDDDDVEDSKLITLTHN